MTTIRMEDWRILWTMNMNGHADLDAYGKDILCACLSTYAYLLRDVTEQLQKEGLLKAHSIEMRPGSVAIAIYPQQEARETVRTVMEALSTGFETLSKQYPESVNYSKKKGIIGICT